MPWDAADVKGRKWSQEGVDVFLEGDSHNGHVVCLGLRSTVEFCKHLDILRGAVPVNQLQVGITRLIHTYTMVYFLLGTHIPICRSIGCDHGYTGYTQ